MRSIFLSGLTTALLTTAAFAQAVSTADFVNKVAQSGYEGIVFGPSGAEDRIDRQTARPANKVRAA